MVKCTWTGLGCTNMQEIEPAQFTCGNEQHIAHELQDVPLDLK